MFCSDISAFNIFQQVYSLWLKPSAKTLCLLLCFGICLFSVPKATFGENVHPKNVKVTVENQYECLINRITPYHNIPYSTELEIKQKTAWKIVEGILSRLSMFDTDLPKFPVEPIVPSPEILQYRNKDDFSVYYGVEENNATVGYLTGTPTMAGCKAVSPQFLTHIKDSHKRLAGLLQDYIKQSPYKPCYLFKDKGFWKRMVVRSNEAGDLMAIIITHPNSLTSEQLVEERAKLKEYFVKHEPNLILYHQECEKVDCSNDPSSYTQLSGKQPYIEEKMGNVTFQISPHSFFQINKKAAEKLVETVWSLMNVTKETTFLDLYSGVGLYSLFGSHLFRNGLGVEYLEGAVQDAKNNAKVNAIKNCEFLSGRVEQKLLSLLKWGITETNNLMTLINPGRAGATKRVISTIREDNRIKKLIYVSCKPDNKFTTNNFVDLCRNEPRIKGTPFTIKRVLLFDLFPRTHHFEMVLEFDRDK